MSAAIDAIVPPPFEVQRRAWECALDLGQEHSETIGNSTLWHLFQHIVVERAPESLTWNECRCMFALHRLYRTRTR